MRASLYSERCRGHVLAYIRPDGRDDDILSHPPQFMTCSSLLATRFSYRVIRWPDACGLVFHSNALSLCEQLAAFAINTILLREYWKFSSVKGRCHEPAM